MEQPSQSAYERVCTTLRGYVDRSSRSVDRDECVQLALIKLGKLWKKDRLASVEATGDKGFAAWLATVVRNTVIDYARRTGKDVLRDALALNTNEYSALDDVPEPGESVEARLVATQLHTQVLERMHRWNAEICEKQPSLTGVFAVLLSHEADGSQSLTAAQDAKHRAAIQQHHSRWRKAMEAHRVAALDAKQLSSDESDAIIHVLSYARQRKAAQTEPDTS
jgi:DNA-directed RNA polymerase specialized sigma24 family protein